MDTFLTEIRMPWDDQKKLRVLMATAMNNTATNQAAAFERAFTGGLYRLFVDGAAQAIERFAKVDVSPETKLIVAQYLRNDSVTAIGTGDIDGSYSELLGFGKVLAALIEPQVRGARWMSGFAGGSLIFLALIKTTGSWPKGRHTWGSVVLCILNGTLQSSILFLNVGGGAREYDGLSPTGTLWRWLDSFWVFLTLALPFLVQVIVDQILLYFAVRSAERSLKQMYRPNINNLGQDSEDIVYDPPKATGACLATTLMNYSPAAQAEGYDATQSNWEASYSSVSQRWSRRASPSVIERQKSISFISPRASLSSPQVTEGMSIPLDRIVALPRPGVDETQGCTDGVYE
ncbi:hypothetical protein RSOLAG22IIIB_09549 [Rhizoctonia solani]|uniref:Uncharacterized protein n=1 Tax=Rhizoctonia solani TaxID=456999 RepID=A0A0K6FZB2_9AGAM|nr:hypothetical protein RSOLAG22IIIB_09549 [Rhizoctonia solani]